MKIDTTFLRRCILTLNEALERLNKANAKSIEYDLYRSACIKEFEIILEQSGKLLRKSLKKFMHSSKSVDQLYFKDVYRHAAKYGIITDDECERWLIYRDNRNSTAHDYGLQFAESTLKLLPEFINDSNSVADSIDKLNS